MGCRPQLQQQGHGLGAPLLGRAHQRGEARVGREVHQTAGPRALQGALLPQAQHRGKVHGVVGRLLRHLHAPRPNHHRLPRLDVSAGADRFADRREVAVSARREQAGVEDTCLSAPGLVGPQQGRALQDSGSLSTTALSQLQLGVATFPPMCPADRRGQQPEPH
eukprot:CAMPEP_0197913498 /NCGR_PEP_ID=MMETSP1439-20131203/76760_1 /TAXON_ID=66791 /ORGANISM="Gonyaulax spinifera, Strain CCMP409" /LENGTH=163 /DNA_ID=CAMNT_0043535359 /DNA_START=322 /DNA_END=811 /DNA_ORIENTATION=+